MTPPDALRPVVMVVTLSLACACSGLSSPGETITSSASTPPLPTTGSPSVAPFIPLRPTSSPSPAVSPPAQGTAVLPEPKCLPDQIMVRAGHEGAGLGHEGVVILFTNTGTGPCTLRGYPGVAGLNSLGRQVTQAIRTPYGYLGGRFNKGPIPAVRLSAGGIAAALVEGTSIPYANSPTCPAYPSLLVTPPGQRRAAQLLAGLPGCSALQVHPVLSGATGSDR